MDFPLGFIKEILGFESIEDLIESLYLKSIIDASYIVKEIPDIQNLDENNIRNEFQKIICNKSGKLSQFINAGFIKLSVENQIINKLEIKRTDIEFFITKFEYIIECKKLTSVSKSSYIDNGISRFTSNTYIKEKQNYAGMCSFVFSNNIENLILGTKKRVSEHKLIEAINDKIICNHSTSFYSKHKKINESELILHHLFFNLN